MGYSSDIPHVVINGVELLYLLVEKKAPPVKEAPLNCYFPINSGEF